MCSIANGIVDSRTPGVDPYVFPHEFAHTLGANHAPNAAINPTPLREYAFDHYADDGEGLGHRNVMVFGIPNDCPGDCRMQLRYSNPRIWIDGWYHTGLGLRDNAQLIGEIAPITAGYRSTLGRVFADDFE